MKAVTLVELIIVMGITAVALTLGVGGMLAIRENAQLQGAHNELLSNLQTYRNMARNSIPSSRINSNSPIERQVDGYAVFFSNNNYSLHYCKQVSITSTQVNCPNTTNLIEKPDQKRSDFQPVTITFLPGDLPRCAGIYFDSGSGQVYSLSDYTAIPSNVGNCRIRLALGIAGQREIIVDVEGDNIK